jgi:excisionase family DNA binding protein
MNQTFSIPMADSSPSVTLTVGQLREVIRQEIRSAMNQNISVSVGQDNLTAINSLNSKPYLSIPEAADLARVAVSTIRLYIRKGRLKTQKVGRRIIISRAELEKFLDAESRNAVGFLSS